MDLAELQSLCWSKPESGLGSPAQVWSFVIKSCNSANSKNDRPGDDGTRAVEVPKKKAGKKAPATGAF